MIAFLRDPRAIALLLAASLTIMSNSTISPALPGIEAGHPDTPYAGLLTRLLITAPALVIAICAPFAGMVADRFGRRRQLLSGIVLFSLAGSAGLVLDNLWLLLGSRLLLGLAVAMIMTAQAALIGDYFAGPERGRFMGLQMAAVNFGGFGFVLIAGWLAGIAPQWPFALYAVGLLYFPFLWRVLHDRPAVPAAAGEEDAPPADSGVPGWPLVVGAMSLLSGLTFILFYVVPTQGPYFLASIGHDSPQIIGYVMSMITLFGGLAALTFGWVQAHVGRAAAPGLGYLAMGAGFFVLQSGTAVPVLMAGTALIGIGFGLVMPNFIAITLDAAPGHRRGLASGSVTTAIFLGQFLSPIVSEPLVRALGFGQSFRLAAVALIVIAAAVYLGLRRPMRPAEATA